MKVRYGKIAFEPLERDKRREDMNEECAGVTKVSREREDRLVFVQTSSRKAYYSIETFVCLLLADLKTTR